MRVFQINSLLASASALTFSAPCLAQTASAARPTMTPPMYQSAIKIPQAPAVEDIIVTAERTDTKLSKTPVAVTVLSGDLLAKSQIVTESDLRTTAPSLGVRSSVSSNQLNYTLRGQSTDAFSDNRPGVLPYFNSVQVGGAGAASAFYDLDSVQVLKGPQGTLFGRNATGGAVIFSSKKPDKKFGGYLSGLVGNYNTYKVESAINIPILPDTILLRVAGFYQKRDGYQYNLATKSRIGNIEKYGFRGSLTIKPSSLITDEFVIDYYHPDGGGNAPVLYALDNKAIFPVFVDTAHGLYSGVPMPGAETVNSAFGPLRSGSDAAFTAFFLAQGAPPGTNLAGAYAAFLATHPSALAGGIAAELAAQRARGPFTVNVTGPDTSRSRNTLITNTTAIDIGNNTQIKNILGYTDLRTTNEINSSGTVFIIDSQTATIKAYQFSNELQIIGKSVNGSFSYVMGGYSAAETTNVSFASFIFDLAPFATAGPSRAAPQCLIYTQCNDYRRKNKTYAGYAQGTYNLSDASGMRGLSATAGARYTSEAVSLDYLAKSSGFGALAFFPNAAAYQKSIFKNVSWTFSVQEQLYPNTLLYVANRRSYRDGGFNGVLFPLKGDGAAGGNAYNTETVTDLEGGIKFNGQLGFAPLTANLAVYTLWKKNAQQVFFGLDVLSSPAAFSVNVPKARVTGFEFDTSIRPLSWLRLGGAVNYTNAKFTDNLTAANGFVKPFRTYPDTPKWSGNVSVDVAVHVAERMQVIAHSDIYAQTSVAYASDANFNPTAYLPGYSVTNFRLGLESSDGWSITANLKNVFNRVYYAGGLAVAELLDFNSAIPGDPRTFTVESRFKF